jgi:hypothetical protein
MLLLFTCTLNCSHVHSLDTSFVVLMFLLYLDHLNDCWFLFVVWIRLNDFCLEIYASIVCKAKMHSRLAASM